MHLGKDRYFRFLSHISHILSRLTYPNLIFYLENIAELIPALREKWGSLVEFVKEIKQGFSRFYNRRHHRKGFFRSERFKSVIVDNGETLINCLAYIDLNPVRAGIAKKPEEYRWCSLGYHVQANNRDRFLSTDFGLREFAVKGEKERLAHYRRFVYEKGGLIVARLSHLKKTFNSSDHFQIKVLQARLTFLIRRDFVLAANVCSLPSVSHKSPYGSLPGCLVS